MENNKIIDYENEEKLGLLLRLPCEQGKHVFYIKDNKIRIGWYVAPHRCKFSVIEVDQGTFIAFLNTEWFPTKEEAEKALLKLKEEDVANASKFNIKDAVFSVEDLIAETGAKVKYFYNGIGEVSQKLSDAQIDKLNEALALLNKQLELKQQNKNKGE